MLDTKHVKKCVDMLAEWGVKSICLAGGGEPSLHPDFGDIVEYIHKKGPEVGISTNGLKLDGKTKKQIGKYGRFCGFSIDAGNSKTWSQLKGSPESEWEVVLENAREISNYGTDLDLTFKMMLVPENQYQIEDACRVAKETGFDNFFVRPAAFEGMRGVEKPTSFDVDSIHEQFEKCLEYEDDQFLVYKSFGRVDEEFERELQFDKCRATPVIAVLCADGYCYLCIDRREDERVRMCKHLELRDFWNSEEHHEMVENIDLSECPRCAFSHYNQQIEAYKNDYMFRWFP